MGDFALRTTVYLMEEASSLRELGVCTFPLLTLSLPDLLPAS